MPVETSGLIQTLLGLPIFHTEWVLWLLIALSVVSIAVIAERWIFYTRHRTDAHSLRRDLTLHLAAGDFESAGKAASRHDSLETNVVMSGLRAHHEGPEAVEDLMAGALGEQRARFETRLQFLATLASNAPYIGLFGTVLGIIKSFKDMSSNMSDASAGVMAGIAEALLATAAGLLVAIPAVLAYNYFKGVVKKRATSAEALSLLVVARLKGDPSSERQ
jgi:biopolymer transport protein ExbB/TolQ